MGNIKILLLDGAIPDELSSIVLIRPNYLNHPDFFPIFRSFLWFANLIEDNGFNQTRIYQDKNGNSISKLNCRYQIISGANFPFFLFQTFLNTYVFKESACKQ